MTTRTVLLLGAAGSGKTTLISDIVRNNAGDRSIAVVFNDDGDPAATDLPNDLGKYADITSMTAGCFGCADSATFLDRIQALQSEGVDTILVEPVGFIDANEMLGTLARIDVKPTVIAIIDAAHHARNLMFGTTEGHVHAAHTVLVTKLGMSDTQLNALAWAQERHNDVRPYTAGEGIDLASIGQNTHHHACDHDHEHGDHCDHHDHSHDAHGHHHHDHFHVATFHARLSASVEPAQIHEILTQHDAIVRAKGDVGATHFDYVQGTWNESTAGSNVPYITFYTSPDHTGEGEKCLEALRPHYAPGWGGLSGTAAATRGGVIDVDTVRYQLELCQNKPLTFSAGHPVPNPEWQELLNELRKRPGVPEELQAACVAARVEHYLRCARWYAQHPERESDPVAPVRLHAIAVGAAWFVSEMANRLPAEMLEETRQFPIAKWLQIGLMDRTRLNPETKKELVIADEAGVTARWALKVGQNAPLHNAWEHNLRLATDAGDPSIIDAWQKSRPQALHAK